MKTKILLLFLLISIAGAIPCMAKKAKVKDVMDIIYQVNDYWQSTHPRHGRAFWDNAAYHTGNMEAYFLTQKTEYMNYSLAWAEHNQWKGAKSNDKSKWSSSYGETDEYVLFGDWQICFQTYADLYSVQPEPERIARARSEFRTFLFLCIAGNCSCEDSSGLWPCPPLLVRNLIG